MNLLMRWRIRRMVKRYARRLGSRLSKDYGASEAYTPGQIRASVARVGLNPRFIAFGYAAFLSETEYVALSEVIPLYIPYHEARELMIRFQSARHFGTSEHYESGLGIVGGLDGSGHGGVP